MLRNTLIAITLLTTACSVTLQDRPRTAAAASSESCKPTRLYWIADLVLTAGAMTAVGFSIKNADDDKWTYLGAAGTFTAIGFAASAANGVRWSRGCREQRSANVATR